MEDKPQFQHPQTQSESIPAQGQVYTNNPITNTQFQLLEQRIQVLEQKRINFNTDIIGLFETVTVAPTSTTPNSPFAQVKISVIAGTTKLNVYDSVNHVWKSVTIV